MKSILRQYFYKILMICTIFIIIINIFIKYNQVLKSQERSLNFGITQVINGLQKAESNRASYEKKLKLGYIERAKAVSGLIKENPQIIEQPKELERLAKILKVDEINIINERGIIIGSSVPRYLGYNMNLGKQSQEFMQLLNPRVNFFFQEIQPNSFEKSLRSYVGVKRLDAPGILQLGLVPERLIEYRQQNNLGKTFNKVLVKKGVSLLIIDTKSQKIISSSILTKGVEDFFYENSSEIIKKLRDEKKIRLQIRDEKYFVVSKEYNNYLISFFSNERYLYESIKWHIFFISIGMIIIFFMIIISLNTFVNKKILRDIDRIVSQLNDKDDKKINIELDDKSVKELQTIAFSINNMYKNLFQLTEQLNYILNLGIVKIGIFEYNRVLDRVFLTTNILQFLNIDEEEWRLLTKEKIFKSSFFQWLKEREVKNEYGVYKVAEKRYVRILIFENEEEAFGIVQDITNEYLEKLEFLNNLEKNESLANIDGLTSLLNRRAFKYIIEQNLKNIRTGVLILFDLDNFKKVNDNEGHPVGDKVLIKFSEILRRAFPNERNIARLGGDEFGVFLETNLSENELVEKLELVFKLFKEDLKEYFEKYKLSTSIGSTRILKEDVEFGTLYLRADLKLYNAKYMGKAKYDI